MVFLFLSKSISKVRSLFMWGERCISHWVSYGLKQGNPLQFFICSINMYNSELLYLYKHNNCSSNNEYNVSVYLSMSLISSKIQNQSNQIITSMFTTMVEWIDKTTIVAWTGKLMYYLWPAMNKQENNDDNNNNDWSYEHLF